MIEFIKFGIAHGARQYALLGPSGIGDIHPVQQGCPEITNMGGGVLL
jgi:hypothetical protein